MTKSLRLIVGLGFLFLSCTAFAHKQEIQIEKITVRIGMSQEEVLGKLRRSTDISVVEDHANTYLIKRAKSGEILGTIEFEESKLASASKNWGRPLSAQLASAPFANSVFDALDDLTGHGRSACSVATSDTSPAMTAYPPNPYEQNPVPVYPPPGAALSRAVHISITCGEKTAAIGIGKSYFGNPSDVSVSVNYKGPVRGNVILDYEGPIRVGNLTLDGGMPEEKALQFLRSSHDISVTKVPQAPNMGELYFIADVENPALVWSVLFEESKTYSASKYWILSRPDHLAGEPFASAVFEAVNSLGGSACTVEAAVTSPNHHDGPTGNNSANDSSSVIKQVNVSCGKKQVSINIATTTAGDNSSVDIAESIFAK